MLSGADRLLLLGRVAELRSVNVLVLPHGLVEAESGAGLLDAPEGLAGLDDLMTLLFLLSLDLIAILMLIMSVLLVTRLLLLPTIAIGLVRSFITIVAKPLLALDFSFFLSVITLLHVFLLEHLALLE